MTNPENNIEVEEKEVDNSPEEPILPSWVFSLITVAGLLVAVVVLFAMTEFNIVGWAGIGIAVISLIFRAFMFPEDVVNLIRGRNLAFGGLGVLVTIVVIVAAVLVYVVVSDQGWSRDFSERDVYSLDTEVRDVLQAMGDDPSIPQVEIIGFYPATQGGQRDRISVLLQDMVNNSGGKISGYQFIDPAIEPLRTETYLGENPVAPRIVVAAVDETGAISTERFEIAARDTSGQVVSGQFQIINAMLSLSVDGDFRAYFLDVEGGLDIASGSGSGANGIAGDIEDEWTVETLSPLSLPAPEVVLNDPLASAEVMIIAGGTQALNDAEIAALNDYLQNGGDLIILADINTDGGVATALNENFSNMLWENFGVRFRNDLVIDPAIPVRQLGRVYLVNNYGTHSIVSGLNPEENQLVVSSPHSIEISDAPPATVEVLVSTGEDGYAKDNLDFSIDLTEADLAFVEGDREGVIPLAVVAENTTTGARVVLFGSPDLMLNEWRAYTNIEAPEIAEATIYWASDAQNFSETVRQLVPEPPTVDAPIFLTEAQLRGMGFVAYGLLPFGMLLLGVAVWWYRRPSHAA